MSNITGYLLRLRVRWYFHALRQFEVKFRQALILIVGLGPGLLLIAIIPYMVMSIVGSDLKTLNDFLILCLFEVLCLLWVMCCGNAVKGEPLNRYVNSLPLSKFQCYSIDLGVLLVANFIAWILLIVGVYLMLHKESDALSVMILMARIVILAALTLTVQMVWFRGARFFLIFILIINFLFVASKSLHSYALLLGIAGIIAMIFILNLFNITYAAGLQHQNRLANEG